MCRNRLLAILFLVLLSILTACGSGGSSSNNTGGTGGTTSGGSTSGPRVVVVMLENQDYGSLIGNANMPFFNALATQNALATNFYANVHPSLANYFMLTAGVTVSTDDQFAGTVQRDTSPSKLRRRVKPGRLYAESLPSVGYTGNDVYPYIKHHNPFAYFDSVLNSTTQKANIVPFSQFASDLSNNALPNYAFVVPSNIHNGHDCPDGTNNCTLATKLIGIDNWLSANVGPVAQNSTFMSNGVLVVTFDESAIDNTNGGGKIAVVIAGGNIKTGFQSTTKYQFENLLRFTMDRLGVQRRQGQGASAANMSEFVK